MLASSQMITILGHPGSRLNQWSSLVFPIATLAGAVLLLLTKVAPLKYWSTFRIFIRKLCDLCFVISIEKSVRSLSREPQCGRIPPYKRTFGSLFLN